MKTDTPQKSPTKFIKRLKIVVTQKEIDDAKVQNSKRCMIREAVKRDHPEFISVYVDKNHIRCTDPQKNCIYTFDMPPRGRIMLLKWDNGEMVKPTDLWTSDPIIRERKLIGGAMRPPKNQQHAKHHLGPVPRAKNEEERVRSGKDRVFGRKLWSDELAKVRADLGVPQSNERPDSSKA